MFKPHIGKTSAVKNLEKPEVHNFSEKTSSKIVSIAYQRVISIPHTKEFPDLRDISRHYLVWGY